MSDTVVGLACPMCGGKDHRVTDSRPAKIEGIPALRRRRLCSECGHKFKTYELPSQIIEKTVAHSIALLQLSAVMESMK